MTKEEASQLQPGDMVYVPARNTDGGWPRSYDRLFGNVYEVLRVDGTEVRIKDNGIECVLYYNEIEQAMPIDLEDSFDSPDIKLLFGGGD